MFETGTATDYRDLLAKLNTLLTATGSAFNLTYAGTGNGTLTAYKGGATALAQTFTITATSATNWTVVGSVSGSIGPATTGTPFSHTRVAFTITAGGTPFIAGDVFTLQTAPKWTARRALTGCTLALSAGGGAGGSSGRDSYENVIDGKTAADSTHSWNLGTLPKLLEFNFPAALTIAEYTIMAGNAGSQYPTAWTFEYWTGAAWSVLDTRSTQTFTIGEQRAFTVSSPVSAARYRLNITAGQATTVIAAVELRLTAGGIDQAMPQYIWEAPGNDGAGAILVGVRSFYRGDVGYYDWELVGFDGFDAAQDFFAQSNVHRGPMMALQNSSTPYWFVVDGRRVIVVAKIAGSQYDVGYLGFLEPFFTPAQFPYPLALGGSLALGDTLPSWENTGYLASNSTVRHRAFTHSDASPFSTFGYATMRARRLDGTWVPFFATDNDAQNSGETEGWIWPYFGGVTNVDQCIDTGYALFPVSLVDAGPNTWGQLSGVSFVTGRGLSAETLIVTGPISHLAVPNISRTDPNDFLAVRLD
jgi:hypothetical protein